VRVLSLFEDLELVAIELLVDLVFPQALLLDDLDSTCHVCLAVLAKFDRAKRAGAKLLSDDVELVKSFDLLEFHALFEVKQSVLPISNLFGCQAALIISDLIEIDRTSDVRHGARGGFRSSMLLV